MKHYRTPASDSLFQSDLGKLCYDFSGIYFLYLAIKKGFEPLLLVPIAFGMLLVNIYPDIMLHAEDSANGTGDFCIISMFWMSGQSCRL